LKKGTFSMRESSHTLDRFEVVFNDERAVADAGLVLPATLAEHLGLRELFDTFVDLGEPAGSAGANVGLKAMTLVHSALAGGDCIDDAGALRAGSTSEVLGQAVRAPSTLGTFLRNFTFGHVAQLDKVLGEAIVRAWAAGAGPEAGAPVTIDLDSSICEVYGPKKQGARFGHTKVRGYHPLLATVAGLDDVLGILLRGGNAHTGRGGERVLGEDVQPGAKSRGIRATQAPGRLGLLQLVGDCCLHERRRGLLDHRQDVEGAR
jgi:hypothetical protein